MKLLKRKFKTSKDILLVIQGAVIAPSDEDSVTFSVNAANGDLFKVRGRKKSCNEFTIPLLDKLLNLETHNWKEHPKFHTIVKFGCKIL